MRVSDNMTFNQVRDNVSKNRSDMQRLQDQAATQKRVTKPSDDPVASARVLGERVDLRGNRQFQKSLNYAKSFLDFTDQSLGELTEMLVRAKELSIGQANDASANLASRQAVAEEVRQIFDQVVNIGNRRLGDRYIFSGYKTTLRPFDQSGKYAGDANEIRIFVDKDSSVAMNIPGEQVFLGEGLSNDKITFVQRKQPETLTELSQLQQSKAEAAENPEDVPPALRGPASDPDQDPHTVSNLPGAAGMNLFSAVRNLEISLRTNDKGGIQDSLDNLDQAIEQVVLARAQLGARTNVLNNAMQTLQQQEVDHQGTISNLEDADVFKVVSDMNKTESTLQATLQTSGKIMPKSLLDFVR